MNKKVIAAAVASALAAPVAMGAQHSNPIEVTPYGRINNALDFLDVDGGDSRWDIRNVSSRIGLKASADLGNGYTAAARYEFATFTDREGQFDADGGRGRGGIVDTRIGTVSLSGPFGSLSVGNQWSAYYNTVGTHLDPTVTLGYYLYSSIMGGPYRASNTVKYSNTFGPVYLELDLRIASDTNAPGGGETEKIGSDNGTGDDLDGVGIGVSVSATENITVTAAYDTEAGVTSADDVDRYGVAVRGNFGKLGVVLGWQRIEVGAVEADHIQVWLHGSLGAKTSWYAGYGIADFNTVAAEPSQALLGFAHKLGGGFRFWGEATAVDLDGAGADFTQVVLGMRMDF